MKIDTEILNYFKKESEEVLAELTVLVEKLEIVQGDFPSALLAEFSQKIDRIMGAAKTMSLEAPEHPGFQRIGRLAELCKVMGYKAAERKSAPLLPIFAAFWGDTIEVTQNLVRAVEDLPKTEQIAKSFSAVLQKRLEWLLQKTDPQAAAKSHEVKAQEAQELLKSLGF